MSYFTVLNKLPILSATTGRSFVLYLNLVSVLLWNCEISLSKFYTTWWLSIIVIFCYKDDIVVITQD